MALAAYAGGAALVVALVAKLDAKLAARKPTVVAAPTAANTALLARLPALEEPYEPFPLLRNRHVSTIFPVYFRRKPAAVQYRRECVRAADGGHFTLDFLVGPAAERLPEDAPLLILLSGIAGGSGDGYVKLLVQMAYERGLRAVAFNSRGCAGGPLTTPQFYSAGFTEDIRLAVRTLAARYPRSALTAAGWSLGANILVNYVGEEGAGCALSAAVSLANPFELTACDRALETGMGPVYSRSMGRSLAALATPHAALFAGSTVVDAAGLASARTVREFDEAITRRSFGFPTVDAYYEASGSAARVPAVAVPLLCVQAEDDPIALIEATPVEALRANPHCVLVTTPSGGHIGWMSGPDAPFGAPWPYRTVLDFLWAVLERDGRGPRLAGSRRGAAAAAEAAPAPAGAGR